MTVIKKPHEISVKNNLKVLIYGQPKIGKTTLALSAPSPLLLDFDGGVNRVSDEHRCDTVEVVSWNDVQLLLKEDLTAYQTLVIDTAGKMLDFMERFIIQEDSRMKNRNGALTLPGYGARRVMFQAFVREISMMGKNLIFVAHEKEDKSDDIVIKRPEIGGSSSADLLKELDLVGYMQAIGEKRVISFNPSEKYYAGNTCGLDPVIQLADCSAAQNNFFSYVFEQQQIKNEQRNDKLIGYQTLLIFIQGAIDEIDCAEKANAFVELMGKTVHTFDSKIRAGLLMRAKARELGLVLNKESGVYGDKVNVEKINV